MIDSCFAFGIFVVTQQLIFSPIRSAFGVTDSWFKSGFNTEIYTIVTISIPVWLYFAILESSPWRATIGKRILGMKVVDLTSRSKNVPFSQSLLRTVVKLLPWELIHIGNNLPEPIWYAEDPGFRIGFLFSGLLMTCYIVVPFLNARRQCIHDMIAGTLVTKPDSTMVQ